jgi:APA family basic amino acid/polyamine antiporter
MTAVPAEGASTKRASQPGKLLEVLGIAFGLAILIGNAIGMGILRTPGEIAARLPSVPLFMGIWIAGATYALLGALSLAELATMRPRSGGIYPLVHHSLGSYPGFVSGWTDWLSTCGSLAAVAIVLGEYVGPLIPSLAGHTALTASVVVAAFALLQWRGIRIGDAAQQVTSFIKALSLIALTLIAFFFVTPSAAPAVAPSVAPVLPVGVALAGAIVVALQSAIFTYDGWTGPIYFGEEIKDPSRNIPRSMIAGVLIVLVIYLALNAAFLKVLTIEEMAGDPFVAATAAARMFGQKGDTILRIVMVVSLIASVNALVLMASRVPFAMSRDRFFPAIFGRVNKGGTPVPALLLSAGIAIAYIATNTFNRVLALLAFLFVANYALAFIGLFVSRRREPNAERPFRVPGYPFVPGLALAGSIAFLIAAIASDRVNSLLAILLVAVSWPIHRWTK